MSPPRNLTQVGEHDPDAAQRGSWAGEAERDPGSRTGFPGDRKVSPMGWGICGYMLGRGVSEAFSPFQNPIPSFC
jgi:hypothetical protein